MCELKSCLVMFSTISFSFAIIKALTKLSREETEFKILQVVSSCDKYSIIWHQTIRFLMFVGVFFLGCPSCKFSTFLPLTHFVLPKRLEKKFLQNIFRHIFREWNFVNLFFFTNFPTAIDRAVCMWQTTAGDEIKVV